MAPAALEDRATRRGRMMVSDPRTAPTLALVFPPPLKRPVVEQAVIPTVTIRIGRPTLICRFGGVKEEVLAVALQALMPAASIPMEPAKTLAMKTMKLVSLRVGREYLAKVRMVRQRMA